jgi:hypothetical protein
MPLVEPGMKTVFPEMFMLWSLAGWPAAPVGAHRRTPGLRRDDVAALAAMSTDYYTRLEQQRGPQPSEQMLSSLARVLRLTSGERDYLFQLAGHNAPAAVSTAMHVAPALLRVLDRLDDAPALILSNLGETSVQNRMADALFGDNSGFTGLARSEIYRWFTDPSDQSQALLVLTAPPRTAGFEKLQLLAVLGHERFADTGQARLKTCSPRGRRTSSACTLPVRLRCISVWFRLSVRTWAGLWQVIRNSGEQG